MKFTQSILTASMFMATACGAPKANQAHVMAQGLGSSGIVILHGSDADQFTEALASAGVPRRLGDMNMSFVVATKLDCTVSAASAGNPVCTITQFDGSTISAVASEPTKAAASAMPSVWPALRHRCRSFALDPGVGLEKFLYFGRGSGIPNSMGCLV